MSLRQTMQGLIGANATESLIRFKKKLIYVKAVVTGNKGKIVFDNNRDYYMYHIKGKDVFFGYYDLQQYNNEGTKLLAHIVDKKADTSTKTAEIVWFEKGNDKPHKIGETRAWCWQQGSRLRWHPTKEDTVLYNDLEDGKYVLKEVNILNGESKTICGALYDVDKTFTNGLTLNFPRLQRLRPGYGYNSIDDVTKNDKAPKNEGVVHIDINTGKETLLFSLEELAKDFDGDEQHYINHICISPSGDKFTFFHIWTKSADTPLKMRFYVSDINGKNLKLLEKDWRISHYCWLKDGNMLATTVDGKYVIYNVTTGEKKVIESEHLVRDGHPTQLKTGFISDTYPKKDSLQYLFRIGFDGKDYKEILRAFSEPRRYGEQRCDLHPRVTANGMVTIDSTCKDGVRSILAFDLQDNER